MAHALFGAAAPGTPFARACEEHADEKVHVGVKRRRRGKRVHKVEVETEVAVILTDALVEVAPKEMAAEAVEVAEEVEVAEKVNEEMEPARCAAQAAPTRKPDEPVLVYKFVPPFENMSYFKNFATEAHTALADAPTGSGTCPSWLEALARLLRRDADAHEGYEEAPK